MNQLASFCFCSRVMDSKWGGKTETINMKLNVEQVQHDHKIYNFSQLETCHKLQICTNLMFKSDFHSDSVFLGLLYQRCISQSSLCQII